MRLLSALLGLAVAAFFLWPLVTMTDPEESQLEKPRPEQTSPFTKPLTEPSKDSANVAAEPAKRNLLAHEKAEIERLAALAEKDKADKSRPETKRYYRVAVRDAGTLEAGGSIIKLAGIKAREAGAQCRDKTGKMWPCGAAARAALTRLIRSRAVTCTLPMDGEQAMFAAHCTVAGTDLAAWLVRQGWAEAKEPAAAELADAAEAAKARRIGLWRGEPEQVRTGRAE